MPFDPISYLEALKSRKLSNLVVDTDKDWEGHVIKNLGEPTEPYDAARKIYVDVAATGLGINYFLLDAADTEVPAYKSMSLSVPVLSEAYVEIAKNSAGDYEIASWIAPSDGIPLKLGVYELHCQAEIISGNIDVRLFFRLYERQSGGSEVLIAESMLSDKIDSRRDVIISLILASDYVMATGSRLVVKLFARYESGGSSTTVRVYYQGDVRSRLAAPIAKEILDNLYFSPNVVTVTSDYTASKGDIVLVDASSGAVTVTLPSPDKNTIVAIKKIDSSANAVTIDAGTSTIDGSSTVQITGQNDVYLLVGDGSDWRVIVEPVSSTGYIAPYAADESELSTTSTSYKTLKEFNLVKIATAGISPSTMLVVVEAYNDTSGQTTYVGIYVDGSLQQEILFTENSYTLKYTTIDVSGLSDNSRHLVEIKVKVSGGTGYLRHLEVYVK